MTVATTPEHHYQHRVELLGRELAHIDQAIARIAWGRLAAFLIAAASVASAIWWTPGIRVPLLVFAAMCLAAFVALVIRHARMDERRDHTSQRLAFARESIAAIDRDWPHLPAVPGTASEEHPYAVDLDLMGDASILHLVDRGATPLGRETLQSWLLAPAAPDVIRRRQDAVRELSLDPNLREEVVSWARLLEHDPQHLTRFLEWVERDPWLLRRPALLWTARALTVLTVSLVVLTALDVMPAAPWLASASAALLLTWFCRHAITTAFDRASNSGRAFQRYLRLIERVSRYSGSAPLLKDTYAVLHADGVVASDAIRHFTRIADRSNLRYSAAVFHLAIQGITLWDLHVLAELESWQRTHGRRVRTWLQALADMEALLAFAGLAHDNPSFTFPEVQPRDVAVFDARSLGHPLIAESVRVANDVTVGPPGTFLCITGSNMSGKSTLLRSIGLNAVLAHAGAPVCAAALTMTPVRLYTSMLVHDSLAHGVSYFMAALTRLKSIVHASRIANEAPLFYLLDEVLQGTNTAERQIAVRRIIGYLLTRPAIGAATTHDLDLASAEPLASSARMVHFTEVFTVRDGREAMSFDYHLRPGVATSRNALKLMELVGLTDEMRD